MVSKSKVDYRFTLYFKGRGGCIMNLDYKVVWSKTKNCYIVVSEIAKRHGKGKPARTCAAALLAAFALTSVMGMSEA